MTYALEPVEPTPEADEVAQWLAWSLVLAFGIWAGWGWLADGVNALTLLLAVVFGLFQVATNILAVKVRELWRRDAWLTGLAAAGAMVATGLLTHESLDHAYAVTQAHGYASADPVLMSWLLLAVPYLEPLLFWINRLLLEPARPARPVAVGLLPLLGLMIFGPQTALAHQAGPQSRPEPSPVTRTLPKREVRATEPARAQAMLMARQGARPIDIHRATGVPHTTCKRWARELMAA